MKAVILAAGRSERLASLQLLEPKPMLMVDGRPLLEHHVRHCVQAAVQELYVNLHHLPQVIKNYFHDGQSFGVNIQYHYEPELLGTAGAVKAFAPALMKDSQQQPFLVIYGDNRWDYSLTDIIKQHQQSGAELSLVVFEKQEVSQSGVVEFDPASKRVQRFVEKPRPGESDSHWVNAGIYVIETSLLAQIPEGISDFGRDLFPRWIQQGKFLQVITQQTPVVCVDTPELYRAQTEQVQHS